MAVELATRFYPRFSGALSAARFWLRFGWSKVTNSAFLTLLVALGTLVTASVALKTARDSHEQVQLLKRQVAFNSSETRPFLHVKPSISLGKNNRIILGMIALGRVPARVAAYDMLVQIGQRVVEPKGGTFNTEDVLYPDQPALGVFQTLSDADAASFTKGSAPIVVGGCVVYGPITADDTRLWRVSTAYRFDFDAELPTGLFANEVEVPSGTDKCDASALRDEWHSQLKLYPR